MGYKRLLTGRRPVLLAALLVLAVLAAVHLLLGVGWQSAWRVLMVHSMPQSFADLRTITHSLDLVRLGYDPYVHTVCDPWCRRFNYPRGWFAVSALGIGSGQTNVLGVSEAALLVLSFVLLFNLRSPVTGMIAFLLMLSPAVLLGVERGNVDLLIFSLLVIGFSLSRSWPLSRALPLRAALIILLTVLKIYPVAACVSLVRSRKSLLTGAAVAACAIIALFLTLRPGDFAIISANTPQLIYSSYGSLPLILFWLGPAAGLEEAAALRPAASLLAVGVGALVTLLVALNLWKSDRVLPRLTAGEFIDDIALACLAVFLLSFLLGSNFDYRLVFLVGTTPPMLRYYEAKPEWSRLIPPLAIVAFLWLGRMSVRTLLLDELIDWALFVGGAGWFAGTLLGRLNLQRGPAREQSKDNPR